MDIKIGKTSLCCSATGKPFEHGEEVVSVVKLHGPDFVREDYSRTSWSPALAQGAIAIWTTRFIDPKMRVEQTRETFSPLRCIFYNAVSSATRSDLAKAYLAAHLLRRQKAFALVKEFEDEENGERIALFADQLGGQLVEVHDPAFSYAELEEARQALMDDLAKTEDDREETTRDAQL